VAVQTWLAASVSWVTFPFASYWNWVTRFRGSVMLRRRFVSACRV